MRRFLPYVVLAILAGAVVGCGGGSQSMKSTTISGGESSEAAAPASRTEAEAAAKSATDALPALPPAASDPAKPAVDTAHAGVVKSPKREPEAPSGVVTAGSFDDNVYPQFFRSFANKAGQNPFVGSIASQFLGRRIEIFVKNGTGAPVGNARIRVSPEGATEGIDLITRSDGRAVFISTLDRLETNGPINVTAISPGGPPVVQTVAAGLDRCTIVLPTASGSLPRNLDIAIVLDTTGSMGDEIRFLKAEVKDIAAKLREKFPNVNQRFSLICYRDVGQGDEYVTRKFDFTGDLNEFHSNLSKQSAAGGGDLPEAMHKGLEDAVNLQWRDQETARILFLIADAPPHAADANATLTHIKTLRKKGVAIYPLFASCNDAAAVEATELVMRGTAMATGAQYLFLTNDSGVGDSHAEPHIPYYHVEKLNGLMTRMIAGELTGLRTDPDSKSIIRTVGQPPKPGRQE